MKLGEFISQLEKYDKDIDLSEIGSDLQIYKFRNIGNIQCIYLNDRRICGGSSPFNDSRRLVAPSKIRTNDICDGILHLLRQCTKDDTNNGK